MPGRNVYPPAIETKATKIQGNKSKKNLNQGRYVYGSINNVSVQEIYDSTRRSSLEGEVNGNDLEDGGANLVSEQTNFLKDSTNVNLSYQSNNNKNSNSQRSSSSHFSAEYDTEKVKRYGRLLVGSSLIGMLFLTVILGLSLISKDPEFKEDNQDVDIPIVAASFVGYSNLDTSNTTSPTNNATATTSNIMSCLDDSCSDFVSMLAQGWSDNANIQVLSCLGASVGNSTKAKSCFTAPATGTQAISNLQNCAMCNDCIKPKNATAKANACAKIQDKTGTLPSSSSSSSSGPNPWSGSGIQLPNFNFTIPSFNPPNSYNPFDSSSTSTSKKSLLKTPPSDSTDSLDSSDTSSSSSPQPHLNAPSVLSCFETNCDDLMKMVAQGWTDNANLQVLSCLGSHALNGTAAGECFTAPASASTARSNLKNCGLCNNCLPAPEQKTKDKACSDLSKK